MLTASPKHVKLREPESNLWYGIFTTQSIVDGDRISRSDRPTIFDHLGAAMLAAHAANLDETEVSAELTDRTTLRELRFIVNGNEPLISLGSDIIAIGRHIGETLAKGEALLNAALDRLASDQ